VRNLLADDNQGVLGKLALSEHLEVTVLGDINHSNVVFFGRSTGLLSDKTPKFVEVDDRSKLLVSLQVEVSLASLSEVARMTEHKHKGFLVRHNSQYLKRAHLSFRP